MYALTPRWVAVLGLVALMALFAFACVSNHAVGPTAAHAASKGDPKDCDDFKTQKKAQKWFKKHNPRLDPAGLDADNDRIACEDNPCPCSRNWHRQHGKQRAERGDRRSLARMRE